MFANAELETWNSYPRPQVPTGHSLTYHDFVRR
jgi:hypothetical protein